MKLILCLCILFTSTQAFPSVIFSAGYNLAALTTSALKDQKGNATGSSLIFKLGFMSAKTIEFGAYSSQGDLKTDFKHDGVSSEISYNKKAFGIYTTYYRKKLYFELGYGKATITEKLSGPLTSNQQYVVKDIYDIHDDAITSDEGRLLVGIKAFNFGDFVTTVYAQRTILFSSDHQVDLIGLELKAKI